MSRRNEFLVVPVIAVALLTLLIQACDSGHHHPNTALTNEQATDVGAEAGADAGFGLQTGLGDALGAAVGVSVPKAATARAAATITANCSVPACTGALSCTYSGTLACASGGTITVSGTAAGSLDNSCTGSMTAAATFVLSGCTTDDVVLISTGSSGLAVNGTVDFTDGAIDYPVPPFTFTGPLSFAPGPAANSTTTVPTGACTTDNFTSTQLSASEFAIEGTICNQTVSGTYDLQ